MTPTTCNPDEHDWRFSGDVQYCIKCQEGKSINWSKDLTISFKRKEVCINGKFPAEHNNCFQWGRVVYCHDCKTQVASSYVHKFFKKPEWLTEEQIKENESKA